jgi:Protein of unknown function (DUF1566)/Calcium-binding EGF domain/EGF-like domain
MALLAPLLTIAALTTMSSCTGDGGSDKPDAGWKPPIPDGRRDDAGAPSADDGGSPKPASGDDAAIDGGGPPASPDATTPTSPCAPNPCEHGGTCTEQAGAASCTCPATWTGARCETDVDECAGNNVCNAPSYPCQNFAGGYSCVGQMADWPIPKRRYDNSSFAEQKLVVDAASGTLLDEITGLMWQRTLPTGNVPSFDAAKQACAEYRAGGHDDWRLPSMIELQTFHTTDVVPEFPVGLLLGVPGCLWTASPSNVSGWLSTAQMDLPYQYARTADDASCSFLCVRTHAHGVTGSPGQRYDTSLVGVVRDTRTGLTWQKTAPLTPYTYAAASAYCEGLDLAGLGSWRLPSMLELLSTHDYGRSVASGAAVLDGPPVGYWTAFWSSTVIRSAGSHIQVDQGFPRWSWGVSGDGSAIAVGQEPSPVYVRCVHE